MRQLMLGAALLGAGILAAVPTLAEGSSGGATETCQSHQDVDVNGDDIADVVVPQPYATVDGFSQAGQVVIYYGGGKGSVTLTQNTDGVPGSAEAGDRFGSAVAVSDLLGDGCDDLVIGAPYEDLGSRADAGAVWRIPGATTGLDTEGSLLITQGWGDFPGTPEAGDRFGASVATDPVYGSIEMVIGSPGEDHHATDAGSVYVSLGSRTVVISQDSTGVSGEQENGDRFGETVGFSGGVVVVGVPYEDVGGRQDAGVVQVFDPSPNTPGYVRTLSQDAPAITGTAESGDRFGAAIAFRHYSVPDDDDETVAVIGVPGESLTSADANHGMVHTIFFGPLVNNRYVEYPVHQNTAGVTGVAESSDQFGSRVSFATFGEEDVWRHRTVTVVSPYEGADGSQGAIPAVQTFRPGSDPGDTDQWIKPGRYGIPADAELTTAYAEGRDGGLFLGAADGGHAYRVPWNNVFFGGSEPVLTYSG